MHADIAHIRFLAKFEVEPKYYLLFLDRFLFKIYTYPMLKGLLKKRIEKTRKNKEIPKFAKKLEKNGIDSLQLESIDVICDIARK